MAKKIQFDCTTDPSKRKDAFEYLNQVRRGLQQSEQQFTVTRTAMEDGGSEIVIRTNGLNLGEKAADSDQGADKADKAPATPKSASGPDTGSQGVNADKK